jgi:imidazolonepropionase
MDYGKTFAVLNCGELVTLRGSSQPRIRAEMSDLSIVPNGAFLVRDGRIEWVGRQAEIEKKLTSEYSVIDARGRVVMPGFVDAHTHPVFASTRTNEYELRARGATYEEIAASGGGIRSTVRKTRATSEEDLFEAAERRLHWFLRNGTTTIEAKSGYGLSLEAETKMLLVIRRLNGTGLLRLVPTFLGAHEIPDEFVGRTDEYVQIVINEMLPEIVRGKLAEYCDIFCEPKIFNLVAAERILTAARARGLGLRVHADQLSLSGATELAARLGAKTADHLEQLDKQGISAMLRSGTQPVALPASVYCLGRTRYAPARAMIDAGLPLVIATDFNPGSSPTPSMPFVLSLACTQMKMTPAEAVTAATINAAHSLGLASEIGSLERGKRADFVIHDCDDYREIPYFVGVEPALATYYGGKLVYDRNYVGAPIG